MKRLLLIVLLSAFFSPLFAADYYWVGGAGSWTDINHWATTSGGTTKHSIIPSATDNVFFDANSGIANGNIITMPATSHAYCNNMSWVGVTATAQFRYGGGAYALYISGNLELAASVAYGMMNTQFVGSNNITIKFNGAGRVPVAGWYNPLIFNKPGATITMLDPIPLALQVNDLILTAGNLDLSGQTHTFWQLSSNNTNARSVNISNAIINTTVHWNLRGSNYTLNAANSVLNTVSLFTDGGTYNEVNISTTGMDMGIGLTTIDKLTFTNPASLAGSVRVGGNNIINILEFKGNGVLRGGGNTINELIMAPGKGLIAYGNNTINTLFRSNTPDCSGLAEITGATGETVTLTFGASAVIDLKNVYITNVIAAGTHPLPIDVVGADGGNTTNWNITNPLTGTTLYWVGGAGDWNDNTHWSATSGGPGGYCVPFSADDVVFDANSGFSAGNNTVTTTSNTWCHNMTWAGVTVPATFSEHNSYTLMVYGSVTLSPSVTMNTDILFRGTEASTFTTNGATLGTLFLNINRTGTNGGVTLTDDWTNTASLVRLIAGKWLMPGRTINISQFVSNVVGSRTIDISNATITVAQGWTLNATGRTWVNGGAGSFITSNSYFVVDGLAYPKVHLNSAQDVFDIRNATIGELVFHNTSVTSEAKITNNNTITSLEFKGSGFIDGGGNSIGTLLMAPSKYYRVNGASTITTHWSFNSPSCSGLGEIRGYNGTIGTLNFGAGATRDLNNLYVQNITATGSGIPVVVNGADAGGNTGFTINASTGSDRYWVGGAGDWNDASHWSLTPGGTGGACIPTVNDNVYFNANSFTAGSRTVTTTGNTYAKNMSWAGATNSPIFNESATFNMEIWGDLEMNPAVQMNAQAVFVGSANATLTTNGSTSGNFDITIDKPNASVSLALNDNLINANTDIILQRGALNAASRTINIASFSDIGTSNANPTSVDISNSNFTGSWNYMGSNKSVNATNSTIIASQIFTNGGTYNKVDMVNGNTARISVSGTIFDSLVFSASTIGSAATLGGNNTIGTLEFKARAAINGTGNNIGTMIFAPGRQYTFANGTNTTITNAWYGSGTPCGLTDISAATGTATVTVNGSSVDLDYIRLTNITAAGTAAPFNAYEHSIPSGTNANWNIEPYAGSTPLEGLGPDIDVPQNELPYRISTAGFFGSPLSSYVWNDGSTLDYLEINTGGTYTVTVSFPDGCSIQDNIVITLVAPLPITIVNFSAKSVNCAPQLNWQVADALNFSRFEIERSADGRNYSNVGSVTYNEAVTHYSYTDNRSGEGRFFYRLRLVDIDGSFKYSNIVSLMNNCGSLLDITPTITNSSVYVTLPGGYENARIRVFNAAGQEMPVRISGNGARRTIDISTLTKAYYFVQVNNNGVLKTVKILKQ